MILVVMKKISIIHLIFKIHCLMIIDGDSKSNSLKFEWTTYHNNSPEWYWTYWPTQTATSLRPSTTTSLRTSTATLITSSTTNSVRTSPATSLTPSTTTSVRTSTATSLTPSTTTSVRISTATTETIRTTTTTPSWPLYKCDCQISSDRLIKIEENDVIINYACCELIEKFYSIPLERMLKFVHENSTLGHININIDQFVLKNYGILNLEFNEKYFDDSLTIDCLEIIGSRHVNESYVYSNVNNFNTTKLILIHNRASYFYFDNEEIELNNIELLHLQSNHDFKLKFRFDETSKLNTINIIDCGLNSKILNEKDLLKDVKHLKRISLSRNGLDSIENLNFFPSNHSELYSLDLSHNELIVLPKDWKLLSSLSILKLNDNRLFEIDQIFHLNNLQEFWIQDNFILCDQIRQNFIEDVMKIFVCWNDKYNPYTKPPTTTTSAWKHWPPETTTFT